MNPNRETMMRRLTAKGLSQDAVPAYIRNLRHTVFSNPDIGLFELNGKLHWLGWNDIDLDHYTFDLIRTEQGM